MRLFDMDSREDYILDGKYKVATPYTLCVDVVEVVRCKECKHRHDVNCPMYYEEWFNIDEGDGYYDSDFRIVDVTEDDGFCDCGERGEP